MKNKIVLYLNIVLAINFLLTSCSKQNQTQVLPQQETLAQTTLDQKVIDGAKTIIDTNNLEALNAMLKTADGNPKPDLTSQEVAELKGHAEAKNADESITGYLSELLATVQVRETTSVATGASSTSNSVAQLVGKLAEVAVTSHTTKTSWAGNAAQAGIVSEETAKDLDATAKTLKEGCKQQ